MTTIFCLMNLIVNSLLKNQTNEKIQLKYRLDSSKLDKIDYCLYISLTMLYTIL